MRHATEGVPYKKVELPKTISQRSETIRQSPDKFWPAIFFLYMVGVAGCNHHLTSSHRRRPVEPP